MSAPAPRLLRFAEFEDELSEGSPLRLAAGRSRTLRDRKFFVYRGDRKARKLLLDLDFFPRVGWDRSMWAYPVILGNIVADELYFHGCVEGDVSARNLYCERFARLPVAVGCAGTLDVGELCCVNGTALVAGRRAIAHTAMLMGHARLTAPQREIAHAFAFPSAGRNHDWSNHTREQIRQHFRDRVIDDIDRLDRYFGVDLEAMIPMRPSFATDGCFRWIRGDPGNVPPTAPTTP